MLGWLSKNVFFPMWEIKDGAKRGRYLRELSASQWYAPEVLQQQQWKRVEDVVAYAVKNCPYYEEKFSSTGTNGKLRGWHDFRLLPLLRKSDVRQRRDDLLSQDYRRSVLIEARTGGSTGKALTVYFDQRCQQMRNAAAMRTDRWAGWDLGMKVVAFWGNPPVADTVKKRLRNRLLDRMFFLDTMNISDASVRGFLEIWTRESPQIIFGHAHSIYIVATYLRRMGVEPPRPRGIISTSMMLLEPERRVIEEVFGCPVTNRYGCEEVGLIASECERHHGLHLNIDHLLIEFLREDGTEAQMGEEADIVVTDLINRGMPLIRYKIEDRGVLGSQRCPCGRGLPLMERIVGRQSDFLKRADGSLVAGISLIERTLTAIDGIEQMQLVQNELSRLHVRIVRGAKFAESSEIKLRRELKDVFGENVSVEVEFVSELAQTSSGKHRFSICNA